MFIKPKLGECSMQQKTSSKTQSEVDKLIMEALDAIVVSSGYGFLELLKRPFYLTLVLTGVYALTILLIPIMVQEGYLPKFIPDRYHIYIVYSCIFIPILMSIGFVIRHGINKFEIFFRKASLTNGTGETPKLTKKIIIDDYRSKYIFDAKGLSLNDFEMKRDRIESNFKTNIESIKHGRDKGEILVTFSKHKIPEKVSYVALTRQQSLPAESMYLGVSAEGIHTQKVANLPHMLIAGTTGSGKSVFFKQALLGLIESTPHLQMYLIDLKGGLEMIDFVGAPNIQVIKTIDQAVNLLKLVEQEMKNRFAYLERCNRKQIVPLEDKKDRIVVAVDEASVLYMNRDKFDPDHDCAVEARRLADSISKLSRAAAIHLLLATQKLDRQVIPTSVSENISGRMAFRANSLQGSLIVLGTKDAMELPEIPGRGIWSFGTKKIVLQSPFVPEDVIKVRCNHIAEMFKNGERKLLEPMLGIETQLKSDEQYTYVGSEINKGAKL